MKKIDLKSVLIGLLIGTNLMFLLGAKQKVDHIKAKTITLFNDDGKKTAFLGTGSKDSGGLGIFNKYGIEVAFLSINTNLDGSNYA